MCSLRNLFRRTPKTPKMYVLVRLDLSETYRMVQGAHALAQYALENWGEFKSWGNGVIVFLAVRNLMELRSWKNLLEINKKSFSYFEEVDLDSSLTAIACFDTGEVFSTLKTV